MLNSHFHVISLAAGLATRLRPLTLTVPKAEIPLFGIPSLHYALFQMERWGLTDIILNTHHLAHRVDALCQSYIGACQLRISHEPEILGSGGALNPMRPWIQKNHFLMINPDVVTDLDLPSFCEQHLKSGALVSMAVQRHNGSVWLRDGEVMHVGKKKPVDATDTRHGIGVFAFHRAFLDQLPKEGFLNLTDTINRCIEIGEKVRVHDHKGFFRDLGDSPHDLLEIHKQIIADRGKLFDKLGIAELHNRYQRSFEWFEDNGEYIGHVEKDCLDTEPAQGSRDFFVYAPTRFCGSRLFRECLIQTSESLTATEGLIAVKDQQSLL